MPAVKYSNSARGAALLRKHIAAGSRFGKLVVVRETDTFIKKRGLVCECICDCGKTASVGGNDLRSGNTKSCGCFGRGPRTHGMTGTPTWRTWSSMFTRCESPSFRSWMRYGGRGITVCDRWHSFVNFLADMGERPDGTSLDRINNDGNYEPGNCRWATILTQANNNSRSHRLTFSGRSGTIAEFAREFGLPKETLYGRLMRGWSVDEALTLPPSLLSRAKRRAVLSETVKAGVAV